MSKAKRISAPSRESLNQIVVAGKQVSPDAPELRAWHDRYVQSHSERLAVDFEIIRASIPKNATLLEMGSVPLVLTVALATAGYGVVGCDLAPERYEQTIRTLSLEVHACDIERMDLPFDSDQFDVVVFNELFEHLRIDPIFTLSEVRRVLKPGGKLLLSTPNLRSIKGLYNFLFRNMAYSCSGNVFSEYSKLKTIGHMGHVREYTTREVEQFLGEVGFEVNERLYRGGYERLLANVTIRLIPQLSPFVSFVAVRR